MAKVDLTIPAKAANQVCLQSNYVQSGFISYYRLCLEITLNFSECFAATGNTLRYVISISTSCAQIIRAFIPLSSYDSGIEIYSTA